MTTDHTVKVTVEREVKCCEQVKCANLRRPLPRVKIVLRADRTRVSNLTFPFTNLSRKEDQLARARERLERAAR